MGSKIQQMDENMDVFVFLMTINGSSVSQIPNIPPSVKNNSNTHVPELLSA